MRINNKINTNHILDSWRKLDDMEKISVSCFHMDTVENTMTSTLKLIYTMKKIIVIVWTFQHKMTIW